MPRAGKRLPEALSREKMWLEYRENKVNALRRQPPSSPAPGPPEEAGAGAGSRATGLFDCLSPVARQWDQKEWLLPSFLSSVLPE